MKKLLFLIPLILFFACNGPGKDQPATDQPAMDTIVMTTEGGNFTTKAVPRSAARGLAPLATTYDTLANGDTLFYIQKDTTVDVPYTYQVERVEKHPKTTLPPSQNTAPVARAGTDQVLTLPANTATLDGSTSTDAENNIKSFGWRKVSGPAATITDSNKSIAHIFNLVKGVYVYELRVSDQFDKFTADQVKITVNDAPIPVNQPPVARAAASPTSITLPASTLNLSAASSSDADGAILSWLWSKVSGPPVGSIVSPNMANTGITGLTAAGSYVYKVKVTDDKGATDETNISVTVFPEITSGETFQLSFTQIPTTAADLNRPGAGVEQWHGQNVVNVPVEGTNTQRLDVYWRFTWARIETSKDNYNWSYLTNILNTAISKRQKVTIGIMSVYHDNEDGVINYDGGYSSYPQYLHQAMQAESTKDWKSSMSGGWVPNYNSPNYLARLRALNTSLNNLLETGSNSGVRYKDIINSIDIRGYGNYGEWHNGGLVDVVSQIPAAAHATTASLKAIIDAHTQTLPNFQLNIIMTAFDANWLQHTKTSPEVAYYALTTRNTYGPIGWRRDNWGATDDYIKDLLERNTRTWNGVPLNSLIMNVWKVAPITGEPMNTAPSEYGDLKRQVELYHAASFGNGNINQSVTTGVKNSVRAGSKAAGYRLSPVSGTISNKEVKITWTNSGLTPTYENWNVVIDLIDGAGAIKYSFISKFKPRLFLPGTVTVTDAFTGVAPGTYKVNLKVVEPYRGNMPLFVTSKNADNSITLYNGLKF